MKTEKEIQNILDRNFTRGDNAKAKEELLILFDVIEPKDIGEEFGCRSDYFNHRVGLFNDMKNWIVEKYKSKT